MVVSRFFAIADFGFRLVGDVVQASTATTG